MGDMTFKEVHDQNKWNLNIVVTDKNKIDESRLLNYLTAPNVVVWSAAAASCAIPGAYDPVELMEKDEDGNIIPYHRSKILYIDGSVSQDLPRQRLSELFNVNTFIVSQVNPHVAPFLSVEGTGNQSFFRRRFVKAFKACVGNEMRHWLTQLHELGLLPLWLKRGTNFIMQNNLGNVTIVSKIPLYDVFMCDFLKNNSYERF